MKVRLGRSTAVAAVGAAFLMVFVLPAGLATASGPDLSPGPAYTLWAYGAVRTVDFSGTSTGGFVYQGTATYGYAVILNQTNLTAQTFELSVNRTMSVDLSVEYCSPSCSHPIVSATLSHHAWESVDEWANFTTNGNVSENGQNVSAIALTNSHSTVTGSLLDTAQGPLRTSYLSANVTATAAVTFLTPLGLFPNDLATSPSWTSSSAFSASGMYLIDYAYRHTGPAGKISIGPSELTGAVEGSGNVTLIGALNTGAGGKVDFGGVSFLNVSLSIIGPFVVREGFILVPDSVDLFGTSNSSVWSSNETGGTSAQMTSLYIRPGPGAHLGIGGSEWLYSASALNPSATAVVPSAPTGVGVAEIASGADNVGSTPVQGVPESVGTAQSQQNCLISGVGCPSAAGKPAVPVFLLGVLAVAVLSVVVAVMVTERRRLPPPAYPNAKLYPPGAATSAPPLASSRSAADRPPPPEEDDPLSNLW
jgi:hypothetical protein